MSDPSDPTRSTGAIPEDLRYSRDHEWVRVEGTTARVGITDYAQDQLGEVVYVELPAVGGEVRAGAAAAEVESTKSVSEVYVPVSGTVRAVNEALAERPELVNQDPYGEGWLLEVELADPSELDGLLDAAAYAELLRAG